MSAGVGVHVVLPDGDQVRAGTLHLHQARRADSSTFSYDGAYLADPRAYPLDPGLPLASGAHQTAPGRAVFGAIGDTAPDRWGRTLMARAERERAERLGTTPRTLLESDYLLGTRDDLRQGALRFAGTDGEFLAIPEDGVPRLVALATLLALTDRHLAHRIGDRDLRDLVNAGGSLGGARPKAAVLLDDGAPAIAKFPRRGSDEWDVMRWEKVSLDLAAAAGIDVPGSDLVRVAGHSVLLLRRFDRSGTRRIGYVSAMTRLEARDGERRSYPEIAEVAEAESPGPGRDLEQLFRRAVFSVLISNGDNHLRNHGFLREPTGWALAPAFDLNPEPEAPGRLVTTIDVDGDPTAGVEACLRTAGYYRLTSARAVQVLAEVERATSLWRQVAARAGAPVTELNLMAAAFDAPERATARRVIAAHRTRGTA